MARQTSTTRLAPIGRLYLIEVQGVDGPYFIESGTLPRGFEDKARDALASLMDEDKPVSVWELKPSEGTMRDVSEDMARKWLGQYEGEQDDLPDFITAHISETEIDAHFREVEADARYCRELASPEAMGRI